MTAPGRRFRLGLFVLGSLVLFLGLLAFILEGSFRSEQATYYIMFEENVKGMVVGSKVNFQGVPVGVVRDMRYQDGRTLVELRVDPTRAAIQDVTQARMDRLLVTGQVTIELEGYHREGKPLPPGSVIEHKADPLNALRGSIPEVVDQATEVLKRLDKLLVRAETILDDGNQARVIAILDNVAGASADLRDKTLPAVHALLADARAVAGEGSLWAKDAREATVEVTAAVRRLEPRLTVAAGDAEALLRELSALANGMRAPAQTALASLRQTLDDVRALARQLKLAPDSILFGVQRSAAAPGGSR